MWYFLLIANLITPLVMIGFGKSFMKSAPKSSKYFGKNHINIWNGS